MSAKVRPNILVTGTPGVGKTTTSEMAAELSGFNHINVSSIIGPQELHEGWDEEFDV